MRAFIRFSSRGVDRAVGGTTGSSGARVVKPATPPKTISRPAPPRAELAVPSDGVASLESRVAALERWRDGTKP